MRHTPPRRRETCRINAPVRPPGAVFLHRRAQLGEYLCTGEARGQGISAPPPGRRSFDGLAWGPAGTEQAYHLGLHVGSAHRICYPHRSSPCRAEEARAVVVTGEGARIPRHFGTRAVKRVRSGRLAAILALVRGIRIGAPMRRTWLDRLTLLAALLMSVGYADPPINFHKTYVGHGFHKVAVLADVSDMELRQRIESKIVQGLIDRRIEAVRSLTVLPHARQFTDQETDSVVGAEGIDAFLLVTIGAPGAESVHFPIRTVTSEFDKGATASDTAGPHSVTPPGKWIGARGTAWPWTRFKVVLFAARTGQEVW